jgi:hypothetical protein
MACLGFRERFTNRVFLRFLRQALRPVLLVVDRHPVYLAERVRRWIAERSDHLRHFFLPGYSTDLTRTSS